MVPGRVLVSEPDCLQSGSNTLDSFQGKRPIGYSWKQLCLPDWKGDRWLVSVLAIRSSFLARNRVVESRKEADTQFLVCVEALEHEEV